MKIGLRVFALLLGATVVASAYATISPQQKGDKAAAKADDKEKDAKPKLGMGDAAPKLMGAKWIKGDGVNSFEPNKVYVLEFWATWCGPCIAAMPHLSELQEEYKGKGLVVVGVTSKGQNTEEEVGTFMSKKGVRMRYAVAFCETDETDTAFMKAADQDGIPCSFVIDKAGKVAYIGHPLMLDDVLPKVLDGTWKGHADVEAIEKIEAEFAAIFAKAGKESDAAFRELADFEKKYPHKKNSLAEPKLIMAMKAKKWDDAKSQADQLVAKSLAKNDPMTASSIARAFADSKLNPERKHIDVAVKAAEAVLAIDGEDDIRALMGVAEACYAAGSKDKAVEYGNRTLKAVGALKLPAEDEKNFREFIEAKIKTYKGEKDDKPAEKAKATEEKKKDK